MGRSCYGPGNQLQDRAITVAAQNATMSWKSPMKNLRREFLLTSAAALAVKAAPADQEIRAAMIGIGKRGSTLIQQVLAQPNVRIAAVCDIDPQARDSAQSVAKRDNPPPFTDYRQGLAPEERDPVVRAVPRRLA